MPPAPITFRDTPCLLGADNEDARREYRTALIEAALLAPAPPLLDACRRRKAARRWMMTMRL